MHLRIGLICLAFAMQSVANLLPENNLDQFDNVNRIQNITEEQFNEAIDATIKIWAEYAPIHGATLAAQKLWNSSTVNAYAVKFGNEWRIMMHGGLARRPEVTVDGFSLVACHELGHHFGGYFFKSASKDGMASEGQSDYFATQACAKELWKEQLEKNAEIAENAPVYVKETCAKSLKAIEDQNLCARSAMAGQSLGNLLAALENKPMPKFETPDLTEVVNSNSNHPQAQCRLDTYFNGSACNMKFDLKLIPGMKHPEGMNSAAAEKIAAATSCTTYGGQEAGVRPRCWFKPLLQ